MKGDDMPVLTVRNVPDEVHRALRARAAQHDHSAEAEVRDILATTLLPMKRVKIGDALMALGADLALKDDDIDALNSIRDQTPAEPMALQ